MKGKKPDQLEEIDGDPYGYFLLAGQTHPYPDDTFYSVGRVPRKLLMKYLGIKGFHANIHALSKIVSINIEAGNSCHGSHRYYGMLVQMYLVRLRTPQAPDQWGRCRDSAELAMACAGILSPRSQRRNNPIN